jgi:hypothetical protein
VQTHGDVRQALGFRGHLAEPRPRAGVGEDVATLGGPDVGGNRDDGDAGDEAAGDREHRRCGRRGEDGHAARTRHAFGHRRGGTDQVAAAQGRTVDAHRVRDVVPGSDGRRVQ